MAKNVALSEAKDNLSAYVDEAEKTHEIIQITRHGRVAAVIMSADDLESLHETLHALRTPDGSGTGATWVMPRTSPIAGSARATGAVRRTMIVRINARGYGDTSQ